MSEYRNPKPVVDVIVEKNGKIVLIRRLKEPFAEFLALPGGFVDYGETVEEATIREAKEETNLDIRVLEILGVYSDPRRDPLRMTMTTVFICEALTDKIKAGDDAKEAGWFSLNEIDMNRLAFDHKKIISDYNKWKKSGGTYWSTKIYKN